MCIITGPTVQLGLDLQYPKLGTHQRRFQLVGVHRRSPGIPASSLLIAGPLRRVRVFHALGLLRGLRPAQQSPAGNGPALLDAGCTVVGRLWTVPTFTAFRPASETPSSAPAASPRLRRRLSPWPPAPANTPGSEMTLVNAWKVKHCIRPTSARLEPVQPLRSFQPLVHSRCIFWPC